MSWVSIPNENIRDFRGKVIISSKVDDNLDVIYKSIHCPSCDNIYTSLKDFRDHITDKHYLSDIEGINIEPETVDLKTSYLIINILTSLNSNVKDNPLSSIRKSNDAMYASEVWRRAWNCRDREEIKLKKDQYEWLIQLMDRKLTKGKDEDEAQTVGMFMYSLSEYSILQHLTTLPDRDKVDTSDEDNDLEDKVEDAKNGSSKESEKVLPKSEK